MDCSMREASHKEQSIAPKDAFFGPIGTRKSAKITYIRVLLVFQKRLDFLQAKEWFFRCFLRPCISGTFCLLIPCNLSRLRDMSVAVYHGCTVTTIPIPSLSGITAQTGKTRLLHGDWWGLAPTHQNFSTQSTASHLALHCT